MKKHFAPTLVFVLILAVSACSSPIPDDAPPVGNPTESKADTSAPETAPQTTALKAGDMAKIGDWEITVESFTLEDRIGRPIGSISPANDGEKYIAAHMTVKNIGKSGQTFLKSDPSSDDIQAKIVYQDEYEYKPSSRASEYLPEERLHGLSFNPLTERSGFLAFTVIEEAVESIDSGMLKMTITQENESVEYLIERLEEPRLWEGYLDTDGYATKHD